MFTVDKKNIIENGADELATKITQDNKFVKYSLG